MILTDADLFDIMRKNPAKSTLDEARRRAILLNTHITGQDLKSIVTLMDYFEDDQKKNLRQKYTRSNVDLFERIHRPIDKVFRAKGGSLVYDMQATAQQDFTAYLSNIRNGMNLRKWIQMVALPAFQIDPMGIVFIEVDDQRDGTGKQQPYPTYKSTGDIYDYKINGRKLEYVILKLSKNELSAYQTSFISQGIDLPNGSEKLLQKLGLSQERARFYRVVDDISDRIIAWDGEGDGSVKIVEEMYLPNYFMTVPALIVSDIVNYNSDQFMSPDQKIVELANDYLTDCSVFNIWKKLHGFPKAWRYRSVCSTCQGQGTYQGRECPDCKGTTYRKNSTPRDEIIVPIPEDGAAKMPEQWGGYITPDIEGWELMTDEMDRLEDLMYFTQYGTSRQMKPGSPQPAGGPATATEIYSDLQSMIDRLDDYREWGQCMETFVVNLCGQLRYQSAYRGCSLVWGNRFALESPDVLEEKYLAARSKGAPQATLDGLLRDYYDSRYATNPMDHQKAMKLMKVEPWTHLTIQQVQLLSGATQLDKIAKAYFSEWISTMDDMDILKKQVPVLRQLLVDYATLKQTAVQADALAAAAITASLSESDDAGGGVKENVGEAVAN